MMEDRLAEYRARKSKEYEKRKSTDDRSYGFLDFFVRSRRAQQISGTKDDSISSLKNGKDTSGQPEEKAEQNKCDNIDNNREELQFPLTKEQKIYRTASIGLKVVLWVIVWALFIELGFGAVYFIVSTLFILYRTMRSGSRDKNKLSAYSVFNPNCERLDGTFTAEQFEKELRYGAASVR